MVAPLVGRFADKRCRERIRARIQLRIQTRSSHPRKSSGLRQPRCRRFQRLVVGYRPLFILIEFAVVEELPPRIFGKRVERSRRLPWNWRLPVLRSFDVRLLIFGTAGKCSDAAI